jgi:hypothetical protein
MSLTSATGIAALSFCVGVSLDAAAADPWEENLDGAYGRLAGDIALGADVGASAELGDFEPGGSLAVRIGLFYLYTVGITVQYNDRLGLADAEDDGGMTRSVAPGVEIRPLFLGRFAQDLEHGPAYADLILDSFGIALGGYVAWPPPGDCAAAPGPCPDHGMELAVGAEVPFLPQALTPYVAVRAAMRWSLAGRTAAVDAPPPEALLTLTFGYRHLFTTHLVDVGDTLD